MKLVNSVNTKVY